MYKVDWNAAEELLVREAVAQFPEIAAKHAEEESTACSLTAI
jgi:hypothetical protein